MFVLRNEFEREENDKFKGEREWKVKLFELREREWEVKRNEGKIYESLWVVWWVLLLKKLIDEIITLQFFLVVKINLKWNTISYL